MIRLSRQWFWLIGLLAAFLLLTAACEEEEGPAETPGVTPAVTGTPAAAETPITPAAEVPGVTATEILLGSHQPLTGPAAVYGDISRGSQAYFDYVNEEKGGVCARRIVYKVEDDQYGPAQTVEVVKRLVDVDKVFAIFNGLGTPTHATVYEELNEKGVPDMYVASGSKLWVEDPQANRYTFGSIPSYLTQEGVAIGQYVADNFPGQKVGMFVQNDEFGREGAEGATTGLAGRNEIVDIQYYTTASTDIRSQVINLRERGAEVVVMYAIPMWAGLFFQRSREMRWDVPVVSSGIIADKMTFDYAGGWERMEGTILPGYLKPPTLVEDPAIQEYHRIIEQYAPELDAERGVVLYGFSIAQLMVETLSRACDNLTRDGLIQAAESICGWEQPLAVAPVSMSPTDHAPFEFFQWAEVADGQFVPFGDIVSFESTPECPGGAS